MRAFDVRLAADAGAEQVADALARPNADEPVNGVLLQLPLPEGLDGSAADRADRPAKDVDGLTPVNVGLLALGRPGPAPVHPAAA